MDPLYLVAALPPGALITAILVVNNLRDIPTDAAAGKRTLAVVLGDRRTQAEYAGLLGLAYAVPVVLLAAWVFADTSPTGTGTALLVAVLLPLLTLPMARPLMRTVRGFRERRELNAALRGTARLSLWFGLLFALGLAALGLRGGGPVW
jgi:1,4-dihydroxy-2-naphthoate octaprenyltransferase